MFVRQPGSEILEQLPHVFGELAGFTGRQK
jgi:hypothetical protein